MSFSVSDLVKGNEHAPHKAVIWISADVYDTLKTGENSGISRFEIKRFPIEISGNDRHETIKKLNEAIEEFKAQCQKKQ